MKSNSKKIIVIAAALVVAMCLNLIGSSLIQSQTAAGNGPTAINKEKKESVTAPAFMISYIYQNDQVSGGKFIRHSAGIIHVPLKSTIADNGRTECGRIKIIEDDIIQIRWRKFCSFYCFMDPSC